ncbi:glutathione S-transferase family protein [Maricurvus nonylphenolicus]|uniref:glutathione S-transferase N-terminal domain-containing protein n=1 Tax=Maricurvus nonylphenolicus TaxID=1008307 RepID=UPI0036F2A4D2
MAITAPIRLYGTYGSPYTRKMLSLLRYRRIPYQFMQGSQGGAPEELPKPKVGLLPTFYLESTDGPLEAAVDSTPLIRRFEESFSSRSVIPHDPAIAFIDYLLEDYGDEWLTKAMFHYRWSFQADIEKAGIILSLEHNPSLPEEDCVFFQSHFATRQISRLGVVGSNKITARVIESSYKLFLQAFNQILTQRTFICGDCPGSADFAFYGQLTQLAGFDPTPMALTLELAPRVLAWMNFMEDLSGHEIPADTWASRDDIQNTLQPLLAEVGRTYVPVMLANAKALDQGLAQVETQVDGKPWQQNPFPYQKRCVEWIRGEYLALSELDREWVDGVLAGTGCEKLLQD